MSIEIVNKKKKTKKSTKAGKVASKPAKTSKKTTTTAKKTTAKKTTPKKATITKKEGKVLSKLGVVVDKFGKQKDKLAAKQEKLKPLAKKVTDLETSILDVVDEIIPKDGTTILRGEAYEMEVKAKGIKTSITDIEKAVIYLEEVKKGLALECATFTLGVLSDYLTPEQYEEVTEKDNVNKRGTKLTKL